MSEPAEPTDREILLAIYTELRTIKRVVLGFAVVAVLWLVAAFVSVYSIVSSRSR